MAEQHDQSNDDCLLCGAIYCGEAGWPLCDTPGCANVCCASCVATTGLSVGDLFYCPACAGGGESAAAVAGGALTAATLGLVDLSKMPLSLKALRSVVKKHIIINAQDRVVTLDEGQKPDEPKVAHGLVAERPFATTWGMAGWHR